MLAEPQSLKAASTASQNLNWLSFFDSKMVHELVIRACMFCAHVRGI